MCSQAPSESLDPRVTDPTSPVTALLATLVLVAGAAVVRGGGGRGAGAFATGAAGRLPKTFLSQLSGLVPVFLTTSTAVLNPGAGTTTRAWRTTRRCRRRQPQGG